MSTTINLNCWILGEDPSHIFPIEIAAAKNVGALKKAIKEEKRPVFDHVPADNLILWNVSIIGDKYLQENLEKLIVDDTPPLLPLIKLSTLFSAHSGDEHLNIVVKPPTIVTNQGLSAESLELNCLVLGEDHSRVFPVQILLSKSVGALKKAIKEEKKPVFDHVPADNLVLWSVSNPVDETLKENLDKLEFADEGSLSPVKEMAEIFSRGVVKKHVHIVVKAPPTGKSSRFRGAPSSASKDLAHSRQDWIKRFPSKPPSQQGKPKQFASDQRKTIPAFHFDRPPSTAPTIPITLLNSIFAQFQEDCDAYAPTREDHAFVLKLSLSMSGFYNDETLRAEQARADMRTYGLDFLATAIGSYRTDGDLRWKDFCYALLEYKDEIGAGGAEPLFQAIWYYVAFMRRLCAANAFSNLPCFIIFAFGPYVGFAGAMWTNHPHLQVLAPVIPLFYHHTDVEMRERAARYFGAAKKAIYALKDYYERRLPSIRDLNPIDRPNPAVPYQMEYTSLEDSTNEMFEYVCQVDADKLVFRGIGMNGDICIKFVRQYSKDAHLECSALGFAPTLQGFESLPGGWYMVVMDFVDDTYELLEDSRFKSSFSTEVRERLTSLHQAGYVHGDIRATNVMVKKNGERGIMLLDFDWAGVIGKIRYPMNVNIKEVRRPDGVIDRQLVLAEHDMAMIDYMFDCVQ